MSSRNKHGPEFPAGLQWSQGAKNTRKEETQLSSGTLRGDTISCEEIQNIGTPTGDTVSHNPSGGRSTIGENSVSGEISQKGDCSENDKTSDKNTFAKRAYRSNQEKGNNVLRFLIIKRVDGSNFDKVNPFEISRLLHCFVGNLKNIKKIRDGILVETVSADQARRLFGLKRIGRFDIVVEPHNSPYLSKGIITCPDLLNCSVQAILDELDEEGVIEMKRILKELTKD